ncbi:MAG: efflux RND transporter periplasmic adaptor subunit [Pseudomonadota bacterium]|jgi:multidrug efflux pump subunit AcrA (membrane-fusion protein)
MTDQTRPDAARSIDDRSERADGRSPGSSVAAPVPEEAARSINPLELALHLQALFHGQPDLALGAAAIASELARTYGAERVSIGLRRGRTVRLIAGSAEPELQAGASRVNALEQAMDESIDQAAVIRWPGEEAESPRIRMLHAQYARLSQTRLTTVPLIDGERALGAVTFEHALSHPDPHGLGLAPDILASLAPVLALRQIAEAGTIERAWLQWKRAPEDRRARQRTRWLVAAVVLAIAVLPVSDRVGAPARIEGELQRTLVSPVDGFLGAVHARPGDTIRAGQVLAEMAREDLELERDRWTALLSQHENAYRNALVRGDRAQYATAFARAAEARADLDRVEAQIARSRLVAPFDGVLIRGDLSQSLGAPVRRGEVLLTVAPEGRHRVIAEIDERDIGRLPGDAQGTLVLTALPSQRFAVTVQRRSPVATSRDGRTFYEVEAAPADGAQASMRPGLQGQVRFDAGRSALAIAWGRWLIDWIRLRLWSAGTWFP